jgi:type II secretory pathway pseudopilin PulG
LNRVAWGVTLRDVAGQARAVRLGVASVLAAAIVTSCVGSQDDARLHEQATAALARYADAVASASGGSFQPAGELTGQVGDWEIAVGDNNKPAVMAGMLAAVQPLSSAAPPDGRITWSDGTSTTVPLLSAAAALDQVRLTASGSCPECTPIHVTGATMTAVSIATNRGLATVPAWSFALDGTAVRVTRVAVAQTVQVVPPPWDPEHAPIGPSIQRATLATDGRTLTVAFIGAPDPADRPCGEDYTAEAVESDLAVAVIVHVHAYWLPASCAAVGAERTATLMLASPLAARAVLEVQEGLPVPVTRE